MPEDRERFNTIFNETEDGTLEPRVQVKINGVTFGPGVKIGKGVAFGGIDLHLYKNYDLAVEKKNGIVVIKGVYPSQQS